MVLDPGSTLRSGQSQTRATNPEGKDGENLTCHNCGSFLHFMKNCPDAKQKQDVLVIETTKEVVFITFSASHTDTVSQSPGSAILDLGCTVLVCGIQWF